MMEFAQLDLDTKKAKIIALLASLKDTDPMFAQLYTFVHTVPTISPEVLDYIYTSIMDIASALEDKNVTLAQSTFDALKNKIQAIEEAEKAQAEKDGSPESLLNTI